jgi:molybdate transport system ATP-binding protein
MMLADHLIVVEDGRIVQQGSAATITAQPRTDYVARLVGLNLYRGMGAEHAVTIAPGFAITTAEPVSGDAFVAFAPSSVSVHVDQPSGSPRNVWPAVVSGIHSHGDYLRLRLDGPIATSADVTPSAAAQLGLVPAKRFGLP